MESSLKAAIVILVMVVSLLLLYLYGIRVQKPELIELKGTSLTVYADRDCGCCLEYIGYLEKYDINITTVHMDENDLEGVKTVLGIPKNLVSCHTSVVAYDNYIYVVEGHVPLQTIVRLVKERPNITGVALPGMPRGAPGMDGGLKEPLTIYAFNKDGEEIRVFEVIKEVKY